MTWQEGEPSSGPVSGGAQSHHGRRPSWKKLSAAAVLVLGAGSGAVASFVLSGPATVASANAVSSSSTSTTLPSKTPHVWPAGPFGARAGAKAGGPGFMGAGPAGAAFMGPGFMGGGVVHASYTYKDAQGTYETTDTQTGTAQDVSSSSITVKSADGFSQTYQVSSSTLVHADYEGILSVKVGDNVSVVGLVDGANVDAQQVTDLTEVQAGAGAGASWAGGFGRHRSGGPNGSVPTTTTTAPATQSGSLD